MLLVKTAEGLSQVELCVQILFRMRLHVHVIGNVLYQRFSSIHVFH